MRSSGYGDQFFVELLGKRVDQLWDEYIRSSMGINFVVYLVS